MEHVRIYIGVMALCMYHQWGSTPPICESFDNFNHSLGVSEEALVEIVKLDKHVSAR